MNASLATIRAGLRPVHVLKASDGDYFLFIVGAGNRKSGYQYRRELGQGHSREERATRREKRRADLALRREYKRERRADLVAENA